ncbi:MAG: hypothetical protein ACHP78_04830 [Terriglobales bacterium]
MDSPSPPETGTYFYSVFGLRVRANRPVGVFLPTSPGQPDVSLHLEGACPNPFGKLDRKEWHRSPYTDDFGQPLLRVWQLNGGDYLHFHYSDGPEFFIDRTGESVWSFWPEPVDFDDVLTYLAGPAFGYLLFVRGVTLLHASAVAVGDKAVALLGPGGAGKSTTAAAFALSKFPVLTDDIVAVRELNGEFLVQPAYLRLCLWPDSVEALYGSPEALPRLAESWEKRGLELGGGCQFEERALPLAAVYVLGERISPRPSGTISRLAPREFLINLVGNSYANRLPNHTRAQEFDALARLVNRVPGRSVTPHPSPRNVRGLCSSIIEDLERIDQRIDR